MKAKHDKAGFKPILFADRRGCDIKIRVAERKDAGALIDFMGAVLGESGYLIHLPEEYGLTKRDMRRIIRRKALRSDEIFLVAEANGRIIAKLDTETDNRYRLCHTVELGLFVRKDYHRRGLGKRLMQAFFTWAKERPGLRRVELHVHEHNQPALALYRAFGFEIEGRRTGAYREDDGSFSDDLIMAKPLPEKKPEKAKDRDGQG